MLNTSAVCITVVGGYSPGFLGQHGWCFQVTLCKRDCQVLIWWRRTICQRKGSRQFESLPTGILPGRLLEDKVPRVTPDALCMVVFPQKPV